MSEALDRMMRDRGMKPLIPQQDDFPVGPERVAGIHHFLLEMRMEDGIPNFRWVLPPPHERLYWSPRAMSRTGVEVPNIPYEAVMAVIERTPPA